jgi:uncharacterized protein
LRRAAVRYTGSSWRISVSFRISKYSCTVVRATCASLATFAKLTIVALHNAATRRKRLWQTAVQDTLYNETDPEAVVDLIAATRR